MQPGQQVTQHDSVMELIDAEHMLIRAVLSHSEVVQLKQDLESSSHLPVKVADWPTGCGCQDYLIFARL